MAYSRLPELDQLQTLLEKSPPPGLDVFNLAQVETPKKTYPLLGLTLGSSDPQSPCLVLVGGVHGLEKIGTQVLLSYLTTLFEQLQWDEQLQATFSKVRLAAIPILNPGGMAHFTRSNPRGVDLMRNSPVESDAPNRPALVGGHRLSSRLPWFRGAEGEPMEVESQALVDFVKRFGFSSEVCLALDFHSGFGMKDRLWYPFAKTKAPFPKQQEVLALESLLRRTYPHHVYKIESQSDSYTTHGDLWDHLYELHEAQPSHREQVFIPWTLEMGSWMWVKKNPLQILNPLGLFHPMKTHRFDRVLRRHLLLVDFFLRATANSSAWRGT